MPAENAEPATKRANRRKTRTDAFWSRRRAIRRAERRAERRASFAGISEALDWYVLEIAPQGETRVANALFDAGIAVYLPEHSTKVIQQRRKLGQKVEIAIEVERPFFPGYLFVGFDRDRERFAEAERIDGAFSFVALDGFPRRIPAKLLSLIESRLTAKRDAKARAEAELARKRARGEPTHGIEPGHLRRVVSGPFAGGSIVAQIIALVGIEAVKVLLRPDGDDRALPVTATMPVAMLAAA